MGFSLGGNFTLRVAAQARAAELNLAQVIAVSPVLDPGETLLALQRGFPGYELYFVRKWLRSLRKKQAGMARHLRLSRAGTHAGPEEHDRGAGARSTPTLRVLEDYLNGYAITGERLAQLDVPASILTSLDDPIIPAGRAYPAGASAGALR